METTPMLLRAGSVVTACAEKISDRLLGQTSLPEVLYSPQVPDSAALTVLAVHLHEVALPPRLLGAQSLRVRAKLGEPGASAKCDSHELQASSAPQPNQADSVQDRPGVQVGQRCLFLGTLEKQTALRFLLLGGKGDVVVALGELLITPTLGQQDHEVDLLLNAGGRARLRVSIEARVTTKGALCRSMHVLGAEKQESSILMDTKMLQDGEFEKCFLASDTDIGTVPCTPIRQTALLFATARMSTFHLRGTRRLATGSRSITRRFP